ncbi:MAG: SufD family Fe-S cluster assembly protein [Pseudomonadota bacterium]
MNAVPRPPVPGSLSNAAYEQRLRDAIVDSAPLLNAKILPISVRSAALNKALAAGLPQLRDDLWRYADLRYLASAALGPAAAAADDVLVRAATPLLPARMSGYTRLVFVNGRLQAMLSDPCPELNLAAPPLVPDRTRHERFGWLNDAFATDVARLAVSGSLRLEIIFVSVQAAGREAVHPRLEVMVAANAELVLVERHLGSTGPDGFINAAVQVHAGAGSLVRHLRWQQLADDAQFLDTTQIALDRDAQYNFALLQLGARSARCSLRASLYGAGSNLQLHGVGVTGGKHSLDHSLLIDHLAPQTTSNQVFRAIARDHARIACRSRVEVSKQARGTRADQSLKGLLDSSRAEIDLRPQLEIHTDEVRASHGATTGALDDTMRFYLLSRGLDPDTARALLEWAFLEDAIRGIGLPELRYAAEQQLAAVLGSHVATEVLR